MSRSLALLPVTGVLIVTMAACAGFGATCEREIWDAGAQDYVCTDWERPDEAPGPESERDRMAWALMDAAIRGEAAEVERLLAAGADATVWPHSGRTPLHNAAAFGHDRVVAILLIAGADADATTLISVPSQTALISDVTPLHLAASYGQAAVVEELLAAGADVHARRGDGTTALELAEENGHDEVIELLRAAVGR